MVTFDPLPDQSGCAHGGVSAHVGEKGCPAKLRRSVSTNNEQTGQAMAHARTGERKTEILQVLAQMLERPRIEKITTAALAARLDVSEAALYRHFASKAQMFEGLIEFIEGTLFTRVNRINADEPSGSKQLEAVLSLLLGFAQKNPGMTRVLIGDALVNEDDRLQSRVNLLHDRLEATLRQSLRLAVGDGEMPGNADPGARANLLLCFVIGRWHQFAKSGFKRAPLEGWPAQLAMLLSEHVSGPSS
jgi:TetR/AcrR family transcriptional regulator